MSSEISITVSNVPVDKLSKKAQYEINTLGDHPYFTANRYNVVHEDIINMHQLLEIGFLNLIISLTSTETISLLSEIVGYTFCGFSILYSIRFIIMAAKYRTRVQISYILPEPVVDVVDNKPPEGTLSKLQLAVLSREDYTYIRK